jgi:hypothetical protein
MHAQIRHSGAWLPWSMDPDEPDAERAVGNLAARLRLDPQVNERIGLFPNGHTLRDASGVVEAIAGPHRFLSRSYSGGRPKGPVVAVYPTAEGLADAVGYAADRLLVVLEWGSTPELEGWATAVGAYNAQTDAETAPLHPELHDEFSSMLMWDREISEGAQRGRNRERVQSHLRVLKAAGLSEDFVIGYALALGLSDHSFPKLRAHYQAA